MAKRTSKLVADICLYGTHTIGAGWLASLPSGTLLGTGTPQAGRSFTEAVWAACDQVRRLRTLCAQPKPWTGKVRVFSLDGQRMATTDLNHPCYYGDLAWEPAIQYVVTI